MAENSEAGMEAGMTVEGSIRYRNLAGTTPRDEDVKWLLALVDELRADNHEQDFIKGWNSALDAIDSVMSKWYDRQWLIDLRAPDSSEFKHALARRLDPLDERHGSGY